MTSQLLLSSLGGREREMCIYLESWAPNRNPFCKAKYITKLTKTMASCYWVAILVIIIGEAGCFVEGGDVTYDGRSLIIDGQRKILFSGSIHYPRSTPQVTKLRQLLFFFFFAINIVLKPCQVKWH